MSDTLTDAKYTAASYAAAQAMTRQYSTSFGLGIRLFDASVRPHIYAIYGLVRVADEIVDSWGDMDQAHLLTELETEVARSLKRGHSLNPIVHAYVQTAIAYDLSNDLWLAFLKSMRLDLTPQVLTRAELDEYIYGSAEVIGLMCLTVFCNGDQALYEQLTPGARALGAAFQRVNFLRDIASDSALGRWYLPDSSAATFNEVVKADYLHEIEENFADARVALDALPKSARSGVKLAYTYYLELTRRLELTPANTLLQQRVRISNAHKLRLLIRQQTHLSR